MSKQKTLVGLFYAVWLVCPNPLKTNRNKLVYLEKCLTLETAGVIFIQESVTKEAPKTKTDE
jgi:hypothetical protein